MAKIDYFMEKEKKDHEIEEKKRKKKEKNKEEEKKKEKDKGKNGKKRNYQCGYNPKATKGPNLKCRLHPKGKHSWGECNQNPKSANFGKFEKKF